MTEPESFEQLGIKDRKSKHNEEKVSKTFLIVKMWNKRYLW